MNVLIGEEFTLGIWRVDETEDKLKELVGGDYFPGLKKITHPRRRLEWLAARCLLKEFGLKSQVMYHPSRRPFLAHSRIHLSISHSYPYVAVIVSPSYFVGVDVEAFSRPFYQVAHKYLSDKEKKWVDLDDSKALALIWSAKETVYKLPGMEGIIGPEMNINPFDIEEEKGELKVFIRMGGRLQPFMVNYYYIEGFNIVWVCSNPKVIKW